MDVIYEEPNNNGLPEKVEFIQHNAALVITAAITGTWKEKLYQEWGLEDGWDDFVICLRLYSQNHPLYELILPNPKLSWLL